jgi:ferredoxin-NADP reductase
MEFQLPITDIIERASNVMSFRFPKPLEFEHEPGQYIYVELKGDSIPLIKHFTISSSPTEKKHIEFTKKLTDSNYSKALRALKKGDEIKILGPLGKFTFKGEYEKVAMLTGGIGITPIRSMCKYSSDKKACSDMILVYGNHCQEDIAFYEEFVTLMDLNVNLKVVFTLTDPLRPWYGRRGRINLEMIKKEIPDLSERVFYICGPPGLVESLEEILKETDLPEENIRKEEFPGYEGLEIYASHES